MVPVSTCKTPRPLGARRAPRRHSVSSSRRNEATGGIRRRLDRDHGHEYRDEVAAPSSAGRHRPSPCARTARVCASFEKRGRPSSTAIAAFRGDRKPVPILERVSCEIESVRGSNSVLLLPQPNPGLPGFLVRFLRFAGSGQARSRLGEGVGGGDAVMQSGRCPTNDPHP